MKTNLSGSNAASTKRRVAYTLAASAAAGAAGVGVSQVEAAIQYSGYYGINILPNNTQPLNLDILAGSLSTDIFLRNSNGGTYQNLSVYYGPGQVVGFNAGPYGFAYVSALAEGDLIDGTTVGPNFFGSMAYGANNPNAEFNNAPDAYIGLSFPEFPNLYFGWIRVGINNAAGTFIIKDWAYNDVSGAGIRAGQIPEPTTLGMLAAGSLGLLAMRRRKSAA